MIPVTTSTMPALFVGHGNPMNAIEEPVSFFAEGLPLGSISMRSLRIG